MSWAKQIFAITLFVSDVESSKNFYAKVFEKSPIFQDENSVVFQFGESLINLLSQSEAPAMIAPAHVAGKESGSRFQITIQVDDVDLQAARLKELEIYMLNGPLDQPWGVRTVLFADPDGHLWELAQ